MEALHLYGVLGSGACADARLIGLDGRQVSDVCYRDLTARVSLISIRAYKSMQKAEVVPYLFAHQVVLEQVMKRRTTVVPVKFGTMARDEAEVRNILESGYFQLTAALEAMQGKIEFDLVAQWTDLNAVLRRIGEEPEIEQQRAAIAGLPVQETTEERISNRYDGAIDFRCVGPLPPYSFATVEVRSFEFEEIDRARRLLGLGEQATLQDAKEAYRRLVQQCHPDLISDGGKVGQKANGAFEAATQAYRLLGEYSQVGSSFRAPDVLDTVAVKLFQVSQEPAGA